MRGFRDKVYCGICTIYRYRFYNFRIIILSMYTVVHLVVSFIKLFQFQCRLAFLIVSDVRIKIIVNLLSSIRHFRNEKEIGPSYFSQRLLRLLL